MRTSFLSIIFLLFMGSRVWSQIDFAIGGAGISPSPISVGETTTLNTFITISDLNGTNSLQPGCLLIEISFNENWLDYDQVVAGNFGDAFNWTFIPGSGLYGLNNITLVDGDGGDVFVDFISLVNGGASNMNINLYDNNSCAPNNIDGNDAAQATVVLPVTYKGFSASNEKCVGNQLVWSTATEVNNSHFVIEASRDGRNFAEIAQVKGSNKSTGSDYSYFDESAYATGLSVSYRLKQVDFDGRYSYSDVFSTKYICERKVSFSLAPNPAKDEVRIEFAGADHADVNAIILNSNGAIVQELILNTGIINKINVNALTPGVYTLQTKLGEDQINERFIVID